MWPREVLAFASFALPSSALRFFFEDDTEVENMNIDRQIRIDRRKS
jgi:hypothetical protein